MSTEQDTEQPKVPSRTFGFSVMLVATLFVIYFLNQQATNLSSTSADSVPALSNQVSGFDASRWFLPAEANLGFIEIPAGPFTMGSNPSLDRMAYENERWSDLRRQGQVDLPMFLISRYETTNLQFAAYLEQNGITSTQSSAYGDPTLPVTNVTWAEALSYARWLDAHLRQSPETPDVLRNLLNNGYKVSLPSEAEWEKAARGTDGRVFPWRDVPADSVANFNNDAPRPVNQQTCDACAWGLNDMAGNVWELTRSPLQDYPYNADDDAEDLVGDALYVMRGGSYADALNNIRTAVRGGADPGVRNATIGFRLVISSL